MKKNNTVFVCQECGFESPKWMGQCVCGAWNAFVEEKPRAADAEDPRRRLGVGGAASSRSRGVRPSGGETAGQSGAARRAGAPVRLADVKEGAYERFDTGLSELNRVLGGGLVKGSLTLISGEPGIGKSTIIIEAAAGVAAEYGPVLYVSGEESEEQIKLRADRVCAEAPENLYLLSETSMALVFEAVERVKPIFLVIDSIQTMYSEQLESAPGSVSQVRACAGELMGFAKNGGVPVFIVAHVTKTGDLAGPRIMEHLVDCVLQFHGERDQNLRILRANKNRFGATSEIGAFEMGESGLVPVADLSESFLDETRAAPEGSVATAAYEGSRPLFLEVQALTAPANPGFARRAALGVDAARLNMILAVLERKAGLPLMDQDVYVNVVGGFRPEGTSLDLAVALAIFSAYRGIALGPSVVAIGEISLTGDLRSARHAERIAREAARLGCFRRVLAPLGDVGKMGAVAGIEVLGVRNLADAIEAVRAAPPTRR
ncbi:MAG: DNA repair protein RadA [Clostridiales Family XIII bacterium]|jgi:DNA repair protein RadA/Sms|nr:DNA repair protein RadA [Clostridiales Family XIII bacterium]